MSRRHNNIRLVGAWAGGAYDWVDAGLVVLRSHRGDVHRWDDDAHRKWSHLGYPAVTLAPDMQGRVFTLLGSAAAAMSPLGLAIAGSIADWLGVQIWYIAGGIVCFLMGVGGFFLPAVAQIEENRERGATPT